MRVDDRRLKVLEAARRDGRVNVESLAAKLGVSAHTIRRDINSLCEEARLRRLHGGAEYVDLDRNLPYRTRAVMNARAKRAIGQRVAGIVPDGATLFISVGTTPTMVAEALSKAERLTVVTNSLNAAAALAEGPGNRIILPGGELRLPDRDLLGEEAIALFGAYRADFGIYGVGGIERDGTLLDFHEAEIRARERIRTNSRTSVLVADRTKFGRHAAAVGGSLGEADVVVIDRAPEPPFDGLLAALPGRVLMAEPETAPADRSAADA